MRRDVVYVGIHPWTSYGYYEDQPDFVKVRDDRLARQDIRQLLLVEEHQLEKTRRQFHLESPYWDGRLVATNLGDPTPSQMSFEALSQHIRTSFPASSYVFWGATLMTAPSGETFPQGDYGCVAKAFYKLRLPGSRIDAESCYRMTK